MSGYSEQFTAGAKPGDRVRVVGGRYDGRVGVYVREKLRAAGGNPGRVYRLVHLDATSRAMARTVCVYSVRPAPSETTGGGA